MPVSYLNNTNVSRGLRNNNPGNLVITGINWQGKIPVAQNTDKTFEQFTNLYYGIRAAALDIINDTKEHDYTLRQLITEYAPPFQNNTAAYINYVSSQTGLNPDAPVIFTSDTLTAILRAVFEVENGPTSAALITNADIYNSIRLLPQTILDELQQFVTENRTGLGMFFLFAAGVAGLSYIHYTNKNKAA
jgi:hypothetical protein